MRFGEWINEMKTDYFEKYRLLGLNISYYRKRARLSQIKMAELLDISRTHMSRIETEECAVSLDVIFRLCEVLQIPPPPNCLISKNNKKSIASPQLP